MLGSQKPSLLLSVFLNKNCYDQQKLKLSTLLRRTMVYNYGQIRGLSKIFHVFCLIKNLGIKLILTFVISLYCEVYILIIGCFEIITSSL